MREKARIEKGVPLWEQLGELDEYERLCAVRLENLVPVREPVVLVSQVQRSGGTLLSRLFDAHPEIHAHPYELHIGRRRRSRWSKIALDRPDEVTTMCWPWREASITKLGSGLATGGALTRNARRVALRP